MGFWVLYSCVGTSKKAYFKASGWYNPGTMKKVLWLILILSLALSGCGGPGEPLEATLPAELAAPLVMPFITVTPLITQAPTLIPTASPTPPPLPTATPSIHVVAEGQTMIGIAGYYGVSLDALGIANPDVNPNYLSVGAELIIPLEAEEGGEAQPASTDPEVLPVSAGEVSCLPDRADGLWCFWPVTNSTEQPVENLTGVIHIYDDSGEVKWSKPAYNLLNLLKPGETISLGVYFSPPAPDWTTVQGQITSAAAANQATDRYLETEITALNTLPAGDGNMVQVRGTVAVSGLGEGVLPNYLWVLAIAFDDQGQVVGLRRWEAPSEALGDSTDFDFMVYSVGRPIDRVEVLVEALSPVE